MSSPRPSRRRATCPPWARSSRSGRSPRRDAATHGRRPARSRRCSPRATETTRARSGSSTPPSSGSGTRSTSSTSCSARWASRSSCSCRCTRTGRPRASRGRAELLGRARPGALPPGHRARRAHHALRPARGAGRARSASSRAAGRRVHRRRGARPAPRGAGRARAAHVGLRRPDPRALRVHRRVVAAHHPRLPVRRCDRRPPHGRRHAPTTHRQVVVEPAVRRDRRRAHHRPGLAAGHHHHAAARAHRRAGRAVRLRRPQRARLRARSRGRVRRAGFSPWRSSACATSPTTTSSPRRRTPITEVDAEGRITAEVHVGVLRAPGATDGGGTGLTADAALAAHHLGAAHPDESAARKARTPPPSRRTPRPTRPRSR